MTKQISVSGFKTPAAGKEQANAMRVPFIRLRHTLWAWTLLGIGAVLLAEGTPHLRIVYTYWGSYNAPIYDTCTYWGLDTQTIRAGRDGCPLIRMMKAAPAAGRRSGG